MLGTRARARRLFGYVATAALLLPLVAACQPSQPATPAAPAATNAPAAGKPGEAAKPAAAGPATGQPIKIGFVWGVTGAVAEIVRPASEASHAYFDNLNKAGGIKGRPVEMAEVDSKYQVPLAQEGYKKVTTEDKVPLVVLASTGDTQALANQINGDKVTAVTWSCAGDWSKPEKNPYIFTICTTYEDQMLDALQFIKSKVGDKSAKIAFSYPDIPFGNDPIPTGRDFAKKIGLELVDEQKVEAGAVDAQSQALNLKNTNPDWVIIQNVTGGASAIVRSGKQVGLAGQFLGLNYAFDEPTIKAIGPQAAEGYIGVGPNAFPGPDVGMVKEIQEAAPQLKDIGMRSIVGWTVASVIADALKRADGDDGTAILKALEKTDLDVKGAVAGGKWTFTDKSHVPTRKAIFYQVKNGQIEKISEPIEPPKE
jgi:branched-chain amino acid transport system substrate-binding protein